MKLLLLLLFAYQYKFSAGAAIVGGSDAGQTSNSNCVNIAKLVYYW